MSGRKPSGMAVAVGGMVGYGYCVNGSSSSASRIALEFTPTSRESNSREVKAEEELWLLLVVVMKKHEEAAQAESLPLLRNATVSRDHAGWAGESVVVVAVQQQSGDEPAAAEE
jgi:hypothetical protein